tara:strand:- start:140 stop:1228 length:1089 start_codon:yes stop_codon:yes gene_type:complete
MKLLVALLGVFTSAFLSCVEAQNTTSDYFGFHYELIEPNTFTPIAVNVTQATDGLHYRSISEAFGNNNEVGLKAGSDQTESDTIWIKDGSNWLQIYYNSRDIEVFGITKGWRAVGFGNMDMGGYIIPLNAGFFIQSRKHFEWYVAFTGYVRQEPMDYHVQHGFNFLNRGYPARVSLNDSKIQLSKGFKKGDAMTGDIVWLYRDGDSEGIDPYYDQYYYSEGNIFMNEGWKKLGRDVSDAGEEFIPNTLIIQTRGVGGEIVLHPPTDFRVKKITALNMPPKPYVYTLLSLDKFGDPYFNVIWQSNSSEINYTTEVWDEHNKEWWQLDSQTAEAGAVLSNWASILGLRYGLGRVVAGWVTLKKP